METIKKVLEAVLPYDAFDVIVMIQDGDLHLKWEALGQKYQLRFVDCIYFEWVNNQTAFGLAGISIIEHSPLVERLIRESDRLQEIADYEMYHFQIDNIYGERSSNLVCHSIELIEGIEKG